MLAEIQESREGDVRKAPPGKFRIIYTDPRDSDTTVCVDCKDMGQVSMVLDRKLYAERIALSVYDDQGRLVSA